MSTINIQLLPQFYCLLDSSAREISIESGRGSGKTIGFADATIIRALERKRRILCGREIQNSIEESVKAMIESRLNHWRLDQYFFITNNKITCLLNGSEYMFKGLSRNIRSLKSLADIDILWIEEADAVSQESLEIILPTIRKPGSQIWYSWNKTKPEDAVYKRFYSGQKPPNSIVKHVKVDDNPFFPKELRVQMEFDYKHNPEMAAHVWGGELRPSDKYMAVIPSFWLQKIIAHYKIFKPELNTRPNKCFDYAGFDVADTGADRNAYAQTRGPLVNFVHEWDAKYIKDSVDIVDGFCKRDNIVRVYYDATGVGAGAKGDFKRLNKAYIDEPFIGAASPMGKDNEFISGNTPITNGQYFRNLKAQAWWNVRMRAENTLRLIDGEEIDQARCLFFNPNLPKLNEVSSELSQASYKHEDGKLTVDKAPDEQDKSPNRADAIIMAYARDLSNGLRSY